VAAACGGMRGHYLPFVGVVPVTAPFTVLPLLVVEDEAGTPSIRCLCGAEGARAKRGVAHRLSGLRAAPPATELATDVTDLGALRMILHARNCQRGQNLLREGHNPLAGREATL